MNVRDHIKEEIGKLEESVLDDTAINRDRVQAKIEAYEEMLAFVNPLWFEDAVWDFIVSKGLKEDWSEWSKKWVESGRFQQKIDEHELQS